MTGGVYLSVSLRLARRLGEGECRGMGTGGRDATNVVGWDGLGIGVRSRSNWHFFYQGTLRIECCIG